MALDHLGVIAARLRPGSMRALKTSDSGAALVSMDEVSFTGLFSTQIIESSSRISRGVISRA